MTMLMLLCCNISAQTHLTFMGIPITGTRQAMVTKLKAKGFSEKTQENEVGVELKGKYLGKDVWLRIYNSNISKTVYLIDIFSKRSFYGLVRAISQFARKVQWHIWYPHRNS